MAVHKSVAGSTAGLDSPASEIFKAVTAHNQQRCLVAGSCQRPFAEPQPSTALADAERSAENVALLPWHCIRQVTFHPPLQTCTRRCLSGFTFPYAGSAFDTRVSCCPDISPMSINLYVQASGSLRQQADVLS